MFSSSISSRKIKRETKVGTSLSESLDLTTSTDPTSELRLVEKYAYEADSMGIYKKSS